MIVEESNDQNISIPEFYRGRSVLVTGFTGTLGKLLVEKLLYSCPDLNKIYVIVRSKRGKTVQQRIDETLSSKAFDRLHDKYPGVTESKLIPLTGDITKERLGLSHEDEELIRSEVSVIFHGAASVRFDDPLDQAIRTNLFPAKAIIDLALTMRKLVCLMYISTAYTNCDHMNIKEELYPAKAKWAELMNVCDRVDMSALRVLSMKYIKDMPNTYTFTKSVAEHVMNDYKDRLPITIVRPSIVVPSAREPLPGWVDTLNGPLGLSVGVFSGMLRVLYLNKDQKCNYVPSDIVINSCIVGSWKTALKYMSRGNDNSLAIYNVATPFDYNMTLENYFKLSQRGFVLRCLMDDGLNSGFVMSTTNELWFKINVILKNFFSSVFVDSILLMLGKTPALTKMRRKILIAQLALKHFTFVEFNFETDNFNAMVRDINAEDEGEFGWDLKVQTLEHVSVVAYSVFKFVIMKPIYDDLKTNSKRLRWLYYIDKGFLYLSVSALAWLTYKLSYMPMVKIMQNFSIF